MQQILTDVPLLSGARVVAGARHLDREIGWPQLVDIPGLVDWVHEGDLLLTTAFVLREPAAEQRALVRALRDRGVVGAFVSVGRYLSHIPPPMRELAERLGFPLVELPWQVPLMEIGQQISRRIVGEHRELLSQSLEMHQMLTQAVVEGLGLQGVAEILGRLLRCSVTIEDAQLNVLASAHRQDVDPARRWSLAQGHTPQAILEDLRASGFFEDLARQPRAARVGPIPDLGMTATRIVAPIVAAREVLGYVWGLLGERSITRLDYVAIEHGATVAALVLTRDRAVREARAHRRRDFLDMLLAGGSQAAGRGSQRVGQLAAAASRLGLDPRRPHAILVVRGDVTSATLLEKVGDALNMAVERGEGSGLVARHQGHVILVADQAVLATAQEKVAALATSGPLVAGIGTFVPLADLAASYAQAWETTEVLLRLGQKSAVRTFQTLGVLHWVYHLPANVREHNPYLAGVRALAEEHPVLLDMLEAYLDRGGNAVQTARDLYLHRSTLLYRLQRLHDLLGMDLNDPEVRLNLHVAVKAYRLEAD